MSIKSIKSEIEIVSPDSSDLFVQKYCLICNYCKNLYSSKSNLDEHIKRMHTPIECSICREIFPSINLYRRHHNNQHSNKIIKWSPRNDAKSSEMYFERWARQDELIRSTLSFTSMKNKNENNVQVKEGESSNFFSQNDC